MNVQTLLHQKHQFRAVLCGHKAVEAGAICLLLMVQGHLSAITPLHLQIASETGLLAITPVLLISFTSQAHHFLNRWTTAAILGTATFLADAIVHRSHYAGEFTEALLTGLGASLFSIMISYTPLGKRIDALAEHFLHQYDKALAPVAADNRKQPTGRDA